MRLLPGWGGGIGGWGGSLLGNYREIMRASSSPQPSSSSFPRTRQVTFSFFVEWGGPRGGVCRPGVRRNSRLVGI